MSAAGYWLPLGATMVMAGDMASGIRLIEDSTERIAGWGQTIARAYGHVTLGAVYLEMATGKELPPPAVILRNLGFLLRTLPFAAAKARRHLEAAVAECRRLDAPYYLAASLTSLGRLHKAKGRPGEAKACFEEARPIAKAVDMPALVDQIDAAVADL